MFKLEHNNSNLDPLAVVALYEECGWNADGHRTRGRTELSIKNSLWYCGAYSEEGNDLIGFARLVGDGIYVVQLVDLMVSRQYRNRGVAKRIVKDICDKYALHNQDASIMLVDGSGISGLYTTMGFGVSPAEQVYYQE